MLWQMQTVLTSGSDHISLAHCNDEQRPAPEKASTTASLLPEEAR